MSAAARVQAESRPILIDKADGPCPYCAEWEAQRGRCVDCGEPIPHTKHMGTSGYQSATVHHFHLESHGGKAIRMPAMRELCEACFRPDYFAANPKAKFDPITSQPLQPQPQPLEPIPA